MEALKSNGDKITITSESDFESKLLCHEIDHLDGIVYEDAAKEVYTVEIPKK